MRLPARHLIPAALASVLLTRLFLEYVRRGDGDGKRLCVTMMLPPRSGDAAHQHAAPQHREGRLQGRLAASYRPEGLLRPALPWAAELRRHIEHARAGKPTGQTVTVGTFTDRAELPEVAAALQQHLRKAVFKANPEVREYATIESDALAGVFDAPILSRAAVLDSGGPAACLYSDFASDGSFNIAQLVEGRIISPSQRPRSRGAGPP
ncbi:hypothetical protein [Streptomyces canus]|uniref:hypothetical protein n=1 Tax=Streptomyces canus TaxID=58343 RepID=UPI002781B726|nr:hypothetical protein [Streptomyces canus]MDQ1067443.1 hypothetical protein [Streptomyces canus]